MVKGREMLRKMGTIGFVLAIFGLGGAQGASVEQNDPYLWLEDVHGEKPLAWVRDQNARSFQVLQADPRYQKRL